ncbi:DEAD/DEAH box helicase [Ruegeria arenilitoris]|uniref:DEAD/DEAH box helicase n=1 Tax=Ruegeria arenilitoris TaxID=1173585 RepID=UPI00147AE4A9|nr:DEAD/DEAH box helicase [Ruegeria arenilitoris]
MTGIQVDWEELNRLDGKELKHAMFKAIQEASLAIQSSSMDEPSLMQAVPRLSDLIERNADELGSFRNILSSLARSTGLWNYIDTENADQDDLLVAEAVTAPELGGITFHREQINALNALLAGQNLILSAPTSFGKSLLVDALLATDRYKRVAVVLPTIALLDEFRRRFQDRFAGKFNVIMHQSEASDDAPTIFLGTQERLIHRNDLGQLDLTVVDEFYKLDPARRDDRSVTLNAAVYRLLKQSRQFFFLGPNIDKVSISNDAHWDFKFLKTRFSTVAVDTLDLQDVKDKRARLIDEIGEDTNWPALVFVSSPDKANKLAIELSKKMAVSEDTSGFANWLKANIGANNFLSEAVEYGFGVHHGRIPRAIAARMVRLFDQQELPVLLCTSTLIEGVNTAAKTVMIFDKKIANESYDFFTFSNIRGRAGRLGQHHVGKVMVFNEVPEQDELEVSPILFEDDEDLPDEYIVHIEKPDRSQRSDSRYDYFQDQLGLDRDGLRIAASVGLDVALMIKQEVQRSMGKSNLLLWRNWPDYDEIKELCSVVWEALIKLRKRPANTLGGFTIGQLTFRINKLRQHRTLKGFLLEQDQTYKGQPEGRDNVFQFLRACEYGLPQHFSVVELFVRQLVGGVDYGLFVGSISSWFKPEVLKELDEEGIPIQISEQFYLDGDTKASLKQRLRAICESKNSSVTAFERDWILDAL